MSTIFTASSCLSGSEVLDLMLSYRSWKLCIRSGLGLAKDLKLFCRSAKVDEAGVDEPGDRGPTDSPNEGDAGRVDCGGRHVNSSFRSSGSLYMSFGGALSFFSRLHNAKKAKRPAISGTAMPIARPATWPPVNEPAAPSAAVEVTYAVTVAARPPSVEDGSAALSNCAT